ncbi:MAG: hypothetical protein PSX80_16880 [bacterium]|nr:hypothetical protein [bacterium]
MLAHETYLRIYDRGNSEMAGVGTFIFTLPSSLAVDRLLNLVTEKPIGSSDATFVLVLGTGLS